MENEKNLSAQFFEAIRNFNIGEVVKIFRMESECPWEYKEKDSGFNGIFFSIKSLLLILLFISL